MATINGTAGNDNLVGTAGNDLITGLNGNDTLTGGLGNDLLDGGAGIDSMVGGQGNDTYYIDSATDIVVELTGEGTDTVYLSASTYNFSTIFIENIYLTGAAVSVTANTLANKIYGNDTSNTIDAGDGNDTIYAGAGNDTIIGGIGNDVLDGGVGNDSMTGGQGNDVYYIDSTSDVIVENAGEGTDSVWLSAASYDFTTIFIDNVNLTGSAVTVTVNSLNNYIKGNDANNVINSLAGADTIYAGLGNDIVNAGDDNDIVFGEAGNDTLNGEAGNDRLYGGIGLDTISGGDGNDILSGGTSADSMTGGLGNDTYYVDDVGDVVLENASEGTDRVFSDITYVLTSTVENLTLSGSANLNGTGNSLDNVITGNAGNNSLTGGAGNDTLNGNSGIDTMVGGTGDDRYFVDNASDVVTENASEGTDTVFSTLTYTLANTVERLYLQGELTINGTGNALENLLVGNDADNILTGNAGNDSLRGGGGNDTLIGGTGNDIYFVDSEADSVTESANEGNDTVYAEVSYTAVTNVENVYLIGTNNLNATGNSVNNVLRGNGANNSLDGGSGIDIMYGGQGDDTYRVDSLSDRTIELAAEGTDTVITALSGFVLAANVENLIITATTGISITGNILANVLTGGIGNDTLTGASGNDTFIGGAGNDAMVGGLNDDTYYVDSISDTVTEAFGEGTDTIYSSVTIAALAANVENLILTGQNSINGTGNVLANSLTGNDQSNILDGGADADAMTGADGNDTYVIDNAGDTVTELFGQGIDSIQSSIDYTLGSDVENLTLTGTALIGTGNTLDNSVTGNASANTLAGLAGTDFLYGMAGNDTVGGGSGNDVIYGDDVANALTGNDSLTGGLGDDSLYGGQGTDTLIGNDDNDLLNGGSGIDTMTGGLGNDTYYVDTTDTVTENAAEGTDTVIASVAYTLSADLENLTITVGGAATGNASNNIIDANNAIANTLLGGNGNDTYYIDSLDTVSADTAGTDIIYSSATYTLIASVENLTLIGSSAINGTGNASNNVITGNASANILAGGGGTDTLAGGFGNDTYVFTGAVSGTITELANQGTDFISGNFSINLATLGIANVEGAFLNGTGLTATGNSGNNYLTSGVGRGNNLLGGDGNDILDSRAGGGHGDIDQGADGQGGDLNMNGGNGSDTYYVSSWDEWDDNFITNDTETGPTIQDTVNDNGTGITDIDTVVVVWTDSTQDMGGLGPDEVIDSATLNLTTGFWTTVENAQMQGDDDQKNFIGNASNNVLTGASGANALTGADGNDSLIGNAGNDNLNGGNGNDTLDGGEGNDAMTGGANDDTYYVDSASDTVTEAAGFGTADIVYSTVTFSLSGAAIGVDNLTLTGSTAANATGNASANIIIGNAGANAITGGGGADTINGGAGNDTYTIDADDVITEDGGNGVDTVIIGSSRVLGANFENLTLSTDGTTGTGNTLNNTLSARTTAANTLIGGLGDDIYVVDQFDVITEVSGEGSEVVYLDSTLNTVNYTLAANVETIVVQGADTGINVTGNALDNGLWGRDNTQINTLTGLAGNDYYVLGGNDIAVEAAASGFDTAYISNTAYTGTLNNIEQVIAYEFTAGRALNFAGTTTGLTITGSTFSDNITGGNSDDTLNGNGGSDVLNGGAGDDTYYTDGGDTITDSAGTADLVYSTGTYTTGTGIENLTLTGSGNTNATGNGLNNILTGNSGTNTLTGGGGSDTYVVNNNTDLVVEAALADVTDGLAISAYTIIGGSSPAGQQVEKAFDNINTSVDANSKYLNFTTPNTGVGIDLGVGNTQIITSLGLTTAGDAAYRDPKTFTLYGSNTSIADTTNVLINAVTVTPPVARNTDYTNISFVSTVAYRFYRLIFNAIVGGGGDTNVQLAEIRLLSASSDTVQSSITYTLVSNVENLTLIGTASIDGNGNTLDNVLTGNAANNVLDGLTGADTMAGAAGDDTYRVDSVGDVVTEAVSSGTDTIITTVNYALSANVEFLIANGAGLTITGDANTNTLVGQGAGTTMIGLDGNDLYVVDDAADVVTEGAGASSGRDTIQTTISYNIAANVEDIIMVEGSAAITSTGNSLDNTFIGNTNQSNTFTGGLGNDTYFIDAAADTVIEALNEGIDTISISATYTLVANVENLALVGSATIDGTGNGLDNLITGGTGNNNLIGNGGNDTLAGGQGADTLTGGVGNTTYNYNRDDAIDTIVDTGGTDILNFASSDVSYTQLWLKQTGNDLEIDIIGTNDSVVVKDWYLSANNQTETINSGDGYTLKNTEVNLLVQAMSVLTQPSFGETGLAPEIYDALELTYFTAWKPV